MLRRQPLSAITGMLSAIDRNHCPPSNGMPVRHHRNTHWKLYIVTLVAQKIKEFGIDADGAQAKKLIALLEDQGLLEADFDLGRLFKQVRGYARSWFKPKSIEGSFAIDPNTGIPTFAGKITPNELAAEHRSKGYISVDALADLANRALVSAGYHIWVLLDRLRLHSPKEMAGSMCSIILIFRDRGRTRLKRGLVY